MKVAVFGARDHGALHRVRELVLGLPLDVTLVSGHARGVDIVAELTGAQRGLGLEILPAHWRRADGTTDLGAGHARNSDIARIAERGEAFPWPGCRGTLDTMIKLRQLEKPLVVHEPVLDDLACLLHTAPHRYTRQAPRGYVGPSAWDITTRSADDLGRRFAPSPKLFGEAMRLLGRAGAMKLAAAVHKEQRAELLAQAETQSARAWAFYEPRYLGEMRELWRRDRDAFVAAIAPPHRVMVCYCARRDRCHRGLLASVLVAAGPRLGRQVVDAGEVRLA